MAKDKATATSTEKKLNKAIIGAVAEVNEKILTEADAIVTMNRTEVEVIDDLKLACTVIKAKDDLTDETFTTLDKYCGTSYMTKKSSKTAKKAKVVVEKSCFGHYSTTMSGVIDTCLDAGNMSFEEIVSHVHSAHPSKTVEAVRAKTISHIRYLPGARNVIVYKKKSGCLQGCLKENAPASATQWTVNSEVVEKETTKVTKKTEAVASKKKTETEAVADEDAGSKKKTEAVASKKASKK
jgi:hypothetical protein